MKKWILLLCGAAVIFAFTSCDQKSASDSPSHSRESNRETGEQPKSLSGSFAVLNNNEMNCSTEEGYYYISNQEIELKNGSDAYHMMYMDYASKKEIILCNRPGCNHDTDECPAVFTQTEVHIAGSLFLYDGYLYLFSHAQDQDGVTTVQQNSGGGLMQEGASTITGTPSYLYRMKKDGSDRKLVFTFDASLSVEDIVLAKDTSMYFITKKLSSEQLDNKTSFVTSTDRSLIAIDTANWKSSNICKLDSDWNIKGVYDDKLIFHQIVFDHALTKEELHNDQAYKKAIKNSQTQISTLTPSNGKSESIVKLSNKDLNTSVVQNEYLYVSTMGEDNIRKINLQTKEETIFAKTNANRILSVYKDVLLCAVWGSTNSSTTDSTRYFINLNDGTINKSKLVNSSMGTVIDICAEMKDTFLVIHEIDAKKDTSFGNEQYSVYGYKYALIKKDDLYNGKANYNPIQMIGFGK